MGYVLDDYDNDGHPDLFVTNFGPNLLYRNDGNGTFSDVTTKAGVAGGNFWYAGSTFGDYDVDGHVDLFVPGYLDFNAATPEVKACEYRGLKVNACGPDRRLYFRFQAVFEDFDNDGRADLFVGNDSNANYFHKNKGDGTFQRTGIASGATLSTDGTDGEGFFGDVSYPSEIGEAIVPHLGKGDIFLRL